MTLSAVKTGQNQSKSEKINPLKNKPFFAIPRHIALLPGVTDRIFRLMAILCSAFGDDGHIEFKISTLMKLMGDKSDKATRRIIKEAEDLELISTQQTGRSLEFILLDKCFGNQLAEVKNDRSDRSKMTDPYHLEKKPKKEKEQSNPPPLSGADLVWHLIEPRHRKTIPKVLVNCIGRHVPDKEIPSLIKSAFEKSNPVGYLWGAVKKKQSPDIKKPQSLTKPQSPAVASANPQKNMAFQEQEKYNRDLEDYRKGSMFMQQGEKHEKERRPSASAQRLMDRMKRFEKQL